ncbi:MAG: hypothetical protein A07HR60_02188 [uncultured archaeon A07HR60]|nr:MAG: hypothetical protein A07HR60_02188 [uncultured archaeon A07HR60]
MSDRFVFDTTFAGKEVAASGDEPGYTVAVEDPETGFVIVREPEISSGEMAVEDADPDDIMETEMMVRLSESEEDELKPETATLSVTNFDYPESWDVSPTPNRVILLKSYASMGGSISGVRNEMVNEVSNPEAFAVAMKDRVLLTGDWRVDE